MKKILYIFLFIGFSVAGYGQSKTTPVKENIRVTKLYPNPATNYINFEFSSKTEEPYSILVFSFIGKKVDDVKVSDQKLTLPLNEYYRGVYIYQLRDQKGNIVGSGKFQVVK